MSPDPSTSERAFTFRNATLEDVPRLRELIATSVRGLSRDAYSPQQIEASLGPAFGVDTELIRDGTFLVVEERGAIVGCGGWSARRTLFGGDERAGRESAPLDPAVDDARIRAFFVHPDSARRGIGRALLDRCEQLARAAGFRSVALMATLPGLRLYTAAGYVGETPIAHPIGTGLVLELVPMRKHLR